MPALIAQSGLFIVSVVAMYVLYGLPALAIIAAVVAFAGGGRERPGAGKGLRWSGHLFARTFRALALVGGAGIIAACIWASRNIGAR